MYSERWIWLDKASEVKFYTQDDLLWGSSTSPEALCLRSTTAATPTPTLTQGCSECIC